LPLLGIGFGLIAAVSIGWDLLEGWLVLAYVLVGMAVVVGGIGGRYAARARAALMPMPTTPPDPSWRRRWQRSDSTSGTSHPPCCWCYSSGTWFYKPAF
jgi:hypothetical protein